MVKCIISEDAVMNSGKSIDEINRSLKEEPKYKPFENDILAYAVRYALGRSSYAPNLVIDYIKNRIKEIGYLEKKEIFISDIKCYLKEYTGNKYEKEWKEFVEYLERND